MRAVDAGETRKTRRPVQRRGTMASDRARRCGLCLHRVPDQIDVSDGRLCRRCVDEMNDRCLTNGDWAFFRNNFYYVQRGERGPVMMRTRTCLVLGCRYPSTHVTGSHKCGTCGMIGHGRRECGNNLRVSELATRERRAVRNRPPVFPSPIPFPNAAPLPTNDDPPEDPALVAGPHPPSPPPCDDDRLSLRCPLCRADATATRGDIVFTGGECSVCYVDAPLIVCRPCRHAVLCCPCAERVARA